MGKQNRGATTKLSIKLSKKANDRIEKMRKNLNLSKAGVILFALANIIDNLPDKHSLLNLEHKIVLEPKNFSVTINQKLKDRVKLIHQDINEEMPMNIFMGLLVSNYFEKLDEEDNLIVDREHEKPKKQIVSANEELIKKILDFSKEHYIPLSGLISYAVLKGEINEWPNYRTENKDVFFTSIPPYLIDRIKERAEMYHTSDAFFIEVCLYDIFMGKNRRF